ncbi:MAG TPA: hypothetical protein VNT75_29510 [Symbiobacteriaceae bacterium]|nr:hypothetical protein [Symbiobacteriaceae bacterium]
MALTAEELLAGAAETYEIAIPSGLLRPGGTGPGDAGTVEIRPLTVRDIQRIVKAGKSDEVLVSILMVKQALVKPALELEQIGALPAGLLRFLVDKISDVSGLNLGREALQDAVQAPLARACFILAKEFGWTPQQVSEMSMGQVMLYLEMGAQQSRG